MFEAFFEFVAAESKTAENYWRSIDSEVVTTYLEELRQALKASNTKLDCVRLTQCLSDTAFGNSGNLPAVLAKLLQLLKRFKTTLTNEQIDLLLKRTSTTHQPLMVALFKILSKQKCDLNTLTDEFSRPDQSTIFR